MTSNTFINNININDLPKPGNIIADMLNQHEENFRTKLRFENEKFKNWIVWDRKTRFFYFNEEKFYYWITCYKDKLTNKKITFYHHKILEIMGKKNYLYFEVAKAFNELNYCRRNKNLNDINKCKIPSDVIHYWIKTKYLNTEFSKCNIDKNNDFLQLEFDDTFHKLQSNNQKHKAMFRMLGMHTNKDSSNIKTIFLQVSNSENSTIPIKDKYDKLVNETNNFLATFSNLKTINLSGDGARIIDKFGKDINVNKRHYDLYHFLKICSDNLNFSSRKNKINKLIYDDTFGNPYKILKKILAQKLYHKIPIFLKQCYSHLKEINASKTKIHALKQLINLWKYNKNSIINSLENENYLGGNAETFIGHYVKKSLKKPFALFSLEGIKHKILCEVPNNINVIFI